MSAPDNQNDLHYDALLKSVDLESNQTTIELADGQLLTFPSASAYHAQGQRGLLTVKSSQEFLFWPYTEQRLRRDPEHDFQGDETNGQPPFWCWRLEGSDESINIQPHVVPGKNGDFIEDNGEPLELKIPSEFIELCASRNLTPEDVLNGFINDLCGLMNYVVLPREDGRSSHGSDERGLAKSWLDRAYFE